MSDVKCGWGPVAGLRKFHYFGEDGRALCGKAMIFEHMRDDLEDFNDASPDNCTECRRRLTKLRAEDTAGA